ncbi:MAG: hypothetical protein ABIG69_11860 [Bacteroidota bacterium]
MKIKKNEALLALMAALILDFIFFDNTLFSFVALIYAVIVFLSTSNKILNERLI